jgi:hypothetical protein
MPANLVKTPADEKAWSRAKASVKKTYGSAEGKWHVVTHIFKKIKDAHIKAASDRSADMNKTAGKTIPGKRDATGPFMGRMGRRRAAGKKCPFMLKKAEAIFWGAFQDEIEKIAMAPSMGGIRILSPRVMELLRGAKPAVASAAKTPLSMEAKLVSKPMPVAKRKPLGPAAQRAANAGYNGLELKHFIQNRAIQKTRP